MKSADIIKKLENLTNGRRSGPLGLGDSMAAVLKKLGVPACESCQRRREVLNRMFPYKRDLFK